MEIKLGLVGHEEECNTLFIWLFMPVGFIFVFNV